MSVLRVAVLVSGGGTNLQALLDAAAAGDLPARIVRVVSDRRSAVALERARGAGVPTRVVRPRDFAERAGFDAALAAALAESGADLVVHAGFMRIVGPAYLAAWSGRCVNVHPSLLPAFPGLDAPRQALEYGVRYSGCTVHFVDEGVDTGPVILQEPVPVHPDDTPETLHRRIQQAEWRLLPAAVRLIAQGRLRLEGRRVHILPPTETGEDVGCQGR